MAVDGRRGKSRKVFRWQLASGSCMLVGMRLSRQVQYALCGIFDLAYNGAGEPVRVRSIGERQKIPYRFLEQIFQRLRKAGLIEGKRGPGGGYILARPPEEITLREVCEAVEGRLSEQAAQAIEDWPTSEHRPDFLWPDLTERMARAMEEILVSDLCREAIRRSVKRDLPVTLDYQI
jgi:Rrf2 family iron-sulfur cluster assembly transcriptional regulator